jgi:hypothetical protein
MTFKLSAWYGVGKFFSKVTIFVLKALQSKFIHENYELAKWQES